MIAGSIDLSIDDFLAAAMSHPGAEGLLIDKDDSGKNVITPSSGTFNSTAISSGDSLKARQTLTILRKALEEKFGKGATDYAWPAAKKFLTAHEISHIIKTTESTASKHDILKEGKHISSDGFIFSADYIAQSRTALDLHKTPYYAAYEKVVMTLDNYENDVATLTLPEKLERLGSLKNQATDLLSQQERFLEEGAMASASNAKHNEPVVATRCLLQSIDLEIKTLNVSLPKK